MFRARLALVICLIAFHTATAEEAVVPAPVAPPLPISACAEKSGAHGACNKSTRTACNTKCETAALAEKNKLLHAKLEQLDKLQHEIAELRAATNSAEQIVVHIQVLELNLTELHRLGMDIDLLPCGYGDGERPSNLLTPAASQPQPHKEPQFTAADSDDVAKVLECLQFHGCVRVLARPTIAILNGRQAVFQAGREIPIPSDNEKEPIGFVKTGTEINVLPHLLGGDKVRIDLDARLSEPMKGDVAGSEAAPIPPMDVRQIKTTIETSFGKSVVLSGMIEKRRNAVRGWEGETFIQDFEYGTIFVVTPERVPEIARVISEPPQTIRR